MQIREAVPLGIARGSTSSIGNGERDAESSDKTMNSVPETGSGMQPALRIQRRFDRVASSEQDALRPLRARVARPPQIEWAGEISP